MADEKGVFVAGFWGGEKGGFWKQILGVRLSNVIANC